MGGYRKIIYCSFFSVLNLVVLVWIKSKGGDIGLYEAIVMLASILGFPLLNTFSKLFNDLLSKRVVGLVEKMSETFGKMGE
jgi:hypothetical protein